jgi:hypothetical protein
MTKAPPVPDDKPKKPPLPPKAPVGVKGGRAVATKQKEKKVIKTFHVAAWSGEGEGEKILGYADSGLGKTTLATLVPTPVWLGLDDGGRKIKHPVTGEDLNNIPGVETFDDFQQAIQQVDLFDDYETVVVDTGTILEGLAHDWMLENIFGGKNGDTKMKNIEQYGWGKGHRHLYDTMRLPLCDFDALIRRGKNILILCQMAQAEIKNATGDDYLCDVPKLAQQHGKTPSVWGMYVEWCDHVFKIGYSDQKVKDKKATASSERLIFLDGNINFKAKSRTVPNLFPLVTFNSPSDDSIWRFIFDGAWRNLPEWQAYLEEEK